MPMHTAVVAILNDSLVYLPNLHCRILQCDENLLFSFVVLNGLTSVQSTAHSKDAIVDKNPS